MKFLKKYRQKRLVKSSISQLVEQKGLFKSIFYDQSVTSSNISGVNENKPMSLIVSLTTFNKRLDNVYLTIESLLNQSHKPDKIVLWLSLEEFNEADIPATLKMQMERGLEVKFCEKNLGPYKKFYYSLIDYPDSLIITVDDDIFYPIDMIDKLYRAYLKEPHIIHCYRGHKMVIDNNVLLPYKNWQMNYQGSDASFLLMPTGNCGVLYFPGCFDSEIMNVDKFMELSPDADDVWLKAMSLKKGTKCKKVEDYRSWKLQFVNIPDSQIYSLKRKNKNSKTGNDKKIKAVFDHYDLWNKFG